MLITMARSFWSLSLQLRHLAAQVFDGRADMVSG
jgi:hypothetical protein